MMQLETELPYAYVDDLRAHALELPYEVSKQIEGSRLYTSLCVHPQGKYIFPYSLTLSDFRMIVFENA